jgi:hypothetical protein
MSALPPDLTPPGDDGAGVAREPRDAGALLDALDSALRLASIPERNQDEEWQREYDRLVAVEAEARRPRPPEDRASALADRWVRWALEYDAQGPGDIDPPWHDAIVGAVMEALATQAPAPERSEGAPGGAPTNAGGA